ncbi:hypothetical protein I7I50_11562 [Histoplasma capsulatum G186AR]|uniref:MARVEL domain-containing protein n=1 Tax=Ajellomyces capsulatus TaxID=5037 RepID=A0A8H7Z816_AJECA|nr:hypothetical protein I7I52_02799 [Histoplasma capsulatum]QSS70059.1 hypothetical protein I7I50_11562 [Histoplasma capsulatum G186AR]
MSKPSTIFLFLRISASLISITGAIGLGWATGVLSSPDTGPFAETIGICSFSISALWSLIALSLSFFVGNDRIHPAVGVTLDLLLGLFAIVGGIYVSISPFSDADWINCSRGRWTSICGNPAERSSVIWRFLAAAFCSTNG